MYKNISVCANKKAAGGSAQWLAENMGLKVSYLKKKNENESQLISKFPFGVFKSPQKTNEIFVRISALASKKRSNQKNM